jgi:hypothetical protein
MDKMDHLMAEKKIIKTAKRGKSHQKYIFKNKGAVDKKRLKITVLEDCRHVAHDRVCKIC